MRALLVALLLLAGCAAPSDDDADDNGGQTPAEPTLSFATPPTVEGQNVTFTLRIEGPAGTSDHIGGHYWNSTKVDEAAATAAFTASKGCVHVAGGGTFPGTFDIVCRVGPGEHYLRGHLRVTDADTSVHHYWTPEARLVVA